MHQNAQLNLQKKKELLVQWHQGKSWGENTNIKTENINYKQTMLSAAIFTNLQTHSSKIAFSRYINISITDRTAGYGMLSFVNFLI